MRTAKGRSGKAKKTSKRCSHCGELHALFVRYECGYWGRKIFLCGECIAALGGHVVTGM